MILINSNETAALRRHAREIDRTVRDLVESGHASQQSPAVKETQAVARICERIGDTAHAEGTRLSEAELRLLEQWLVSCDGQSTSPEATQVLRTLRRIARQCRLYANAANALDAQRVSPITMSA